MRVTPCKAGHSIAEATAGSSNTRTRVPPPLREEEQCCQLPGSHWIPSLLPAAASHGSGSLAGHSHALLSHWQKEEEEDRQTYQILQQHCLVCDLCCSPKPTVSKEKSVNATDTAGSRNSSPVPGSTPSPQGWAGTKRDQRNYRGGDSKIQLCPALSDPAQASSSQPHASVSPHVTLAAIPMSHTSGGYRQGPTAAGGENRHPQRFVEMPMP